MTVHDDLATLRNVLSLGDTALRQESDYALTALSRVEAEIARLSEERDAFRLTLFKWVNRRRDEELEILGAEAGWDGATTEWQRRAESEVARLRDGLRRIADQQTKTVDWLRANGIVFDDLDDHWQKVAFSIYNDLCEVDAWAHDALDEGIDGKPRALLADQDGAAHPSCRGRA